MKISLNEIPVRDIYAGYVDRDEEGVVGYNGNLNIRPKYQRDFVYKDNQRDAVIYSVRNDFPLNVMYWSKGQDGKFELLDGQQRTLSVTKYISGAYSINYKYFHNLTREEQEQILNYKFMVYFCEGTDKEKLDWFRVVNTAGEPLNAQELRNAIYTGEWLTEAKRYFSKTGCAAHGLAGDYLRGSAIRQDYLETAIRWIAAKDNKEIEDYMSEHQHDTNANEIWLYFNAVISWVIATFPKYRSFMKGIEWGIYYNRYKNKKFDPKALEQRIVELLEDEDVTSNSGIYEYLIDGNEKHLSIRAFTPKIKHLAYERQKGICVRCQQHFEIEKMEPDHITPWHLGGKTIAENCQMLCIDCNRRKSGK